MTDLADDIRRAARRSGRNRALGAIAFFALILGLIAGITAAVQIPSALSDLHENTDLRAHGKQVTAVITRVDRKLYHGYRGPDWIEYWPETTVTVNGHTASSTLRDYFTQSSRTFTAGHRIHVLTDPGDPSRMILASDAARKRIVTQARNATIFGIVALVLLGYGVPVAVIGLRGTPRVPIPKPRTGDAHAAHRAGRDQ